jgi:ABC-2 type transport system permease protein
MIKRLLAVLHARNLEFVRDRGTLLFTLLLPIMLVVGMGFVFGGPERPLFKVGVVTPRIDRQANAFLSERYVEFVAEPDETSGLYKVTHQQIDLLLSLGPPLRYWVNTDSPKGYIVEKLLLAADPHAHREVVAGAAVRYVDWRGGALPRLAVSGHPRHEHDVQLPVRRRLRGGALPQERLPQAPARDPAHRV